MEDTRPSTSARARARRPRQRPRHKGRGKEEVHPHSRVQQVGHHHSRRSSTRGERAAAGVRVLASLPATASRDDTSSVPPPPPCTQRVDTGCAAPVPSAGATSPNQTHQDRDARGCVACVPEACRVCAAGKPTPVVGARSRGGGGACNARPCGAGGTAEAVRLAHNPARAPRVAAGRRARAVGGVGPRQPKHTKKKSAPRGSARGGCGGAGWRWRRARVGWWEGGGRGGVGGWVWGTHTPTRRRHTCFGRGSGGCVPKWRVGGPPLGRMGGGCPSRPRHGAWRARFFEGGEVGAPQSWPLRPRAGSDGDAV